MTAAWVLDCHYNIVHVPSSPQTTTTGVGVAKCWADLEIFAPNLRRDVGLHMAVKVQPAPLYKGAASVY